MKHLGDIAKINGAEIEIVDVITGGSPCQDLSIAGKRAGLAGARSGLFMAQIRIVKEMREHDRANGRTGDMVRPRFMVWENVPGAFSSNKGQDFAAVLATRHWVTPSPCPSGISWQSVSVRNIFALLRWVACLTVSAAFRWCSSGTTARELRAGQARSRNFLSP